MDTGDSFQNSLSLLKKKKKKNNNKKKGTISTITHILTLFGTWCTVQVHVNELLL